MPAVLEFSEPSPTFVLPARRSDLVFRALDIGRYVVKDPRTGNYFDLGEQENFLFSQLDGTATADVVRSNFESNFGESLSEEDLQGFIGLAQSQGFLRQEPSQKIVEPSETNKPSDAEIASSKNVLRSRGSLLYWRVSLFDPDWLFNRLIPHLRFLWTRGFVVASLLLMLMAGFVVWTNWGELVSRFVGALRWQTAVVVWVTLLTATTLHEFAHGLTCKRFGGEVHEVGFLMMFFVPCMYCNVSDAWLFRERSKRLLVTLAGGWCDMGLWALAVLFWRMTLPESLPNYIAWVVLTVLSARVLFNFNPLMKLDGYYLLSDMKRVPNLQQRGADRFKQHLRQVLWGAAPPEPDPRGAFLTVYGLLAWIFSMVFLGVMLVTLFQFLWARWGLIAFAVVAFLAGVTGRGLLRGLGGGEMLQMIRKFRKRTVVWILILSGLPLALGLIPMEDRVSGPFQVRATVRAEVRAPLTGFVREVNFDEGQPVSTGTVIARLEIPDLDSRVAQKRAEVLEAEAKLRMVEAGAKPEEVSEQRSRVVRARTWHDLALQDLERARTGTREEVARLEKLTSQYEAEQVFAQKAYDRVKQLRERGNASEVEMQEAAKELEVYKSKAEQSRAQKRSLQAIAMRDAMNEVARRDKELADALGSLELLEAGSRPEEIAAARALRARAKEELRYLESLGAHLLIRSTANGIITTPRLKEKVGQYLREGDLICQVEELRTLEAEIVLNEQDVSRVQAEFAVELKARSLPFDSFNSRVERIASSATRFDPNTPPPAGATAAPIQPKPDAPGSVIVYCRLDGVNPQLRPGMTGFARISCGQRPLGEILYQRVARFVRTEFWW